MKRLNQGGLFHQQHLSRAFDGAVKPALVMGWQAGIFPRQDSACVGDELFEQVDVLKIQRVHGEINFRLGPGRARFHRPSPTRAATRFIDVGLARHNLFDFAVHGVAAKKGVVLFQLQFLRL